MSSATKRLRAGLKDRGIEWLEIPAPQSITEWHVGDTRWTAIQSQGGPDGTSDYLCMQSWFMATPEQAIAATLGPGTCTVKRIDELGELYGIKLSCGHSMLNPLDMPPIYCPWCGKKVVEVNE